MTEIAIITGADAAYAGMLEECLRSIRNKPESRQIDLTLGLLDVGLGPHRARLAALADDIVEPGWDIDFPARPETPGYYRAMFARPFLPRYFPGHRLYLWIDADAWVQDWRAIELFIEAARETDPASGQPLLAAVPEIDRSYRNFFGAWQEFHDVIRKGYADAFDEATADELVRHPLINSGVFAMRAEAPHWQAWADTLTAALQRRMNPLIEQSCLNHVIYRQKLPASFLPSWCNWICHHAAPRRDEKSGALTEPLLPYQRLGIVHRTMWTKGEWGSGRN
jgi:lipopolysaccharide biosynthesis glycosyltransferase